MAYKLNQRLAYRLPVAASSTVDKGGAGQVGVAINSDLEVPVAAGDGGGVNFMGRQSAYEILDGTNTIGDIVDIKQQQRLPPAQSRAIVLPLPTSDNLGTVEMARLAALPNRFAPFPLPLKAVQLRRRILRFAIGSIIFTVAWLLVLAAVIVTKDGSFTQQTIAHFVFRYYPCHPCLLT
jgi:hypothetical protein